MDMKQFTVATYNIHHGHDVGLDFSRLGFVLAASGADIVGIQEVDVETNRVLGRNTLAELAVAAGFEHSFFIPAMDYDGGRYGTAILSKHPLRNAVAYELFSGTCEPRSVGIAEIALPNGTVIRIVNTHLCVDSAEVRSIQVKQIAYRCGELLDTSVPTLITGDFNVQALDELSPFGEYGFKTINDEHAHYATFRPTPMGIDHILYLQDKFNPIDHGMLDYDTSDHNLLWCRFSLS